MLTRANILFLVSQATLLGCMLVSLGCLAQEDSIRHQILNYGAPNNELIYRGRKMILDKIIADDREKVKEVMTYLIDSTEDRHYVAFNSMEKWLLYYWSGQYEQILSDARRFEAFLWQDEGRSVPVQDVLYREVQAKVTYDRLKIQMDINQTDLPAMEKAFLVLNLGFLSEDNSRPGAQESINQACNGFISLYPNTEFEPYILKYLRFQFKPSEWGLAYAFFTGYGVLTDELSDKFTNPVPVGLDFDVSYKKFSLFFRIYIGLGETRDSINFPNATWKKEALTQLFLPEASVGYAVYSDRSVKLTPFVGISSMRVCPPESDRKKFPEYEHVGLNYTTTFTAGLNADFLIGKTESITSWGYGQRTSYLFVRLRYAYNQPGFDSEYPGFSGNLHSLTLGLGLFSRAWRRD
jgi:hypothetical protein